MTNSRDLILKLKEIKDNENLSLSEIEARTERNGEHISKTTLSRVFADGSEDITFRFESTLKPIANALLYIDTIEETDNLDTQGLKIMLQYKADKIKELEAKLDHEEVRHIEKIEKERAHFNKSIGFLERQIELKDERITALMAENNMLIKEVLSCPKRKECGK